MTAILTAEPVTLATTERRAADELREKTNAATLRDTRRTALRRIRNQEVTGSSPVNGSIPASHRRMRLFSHATLLLLVSTALRAQCPAFSDAVYYNNMPGEPRAIAVADFNGDGKADLAIGGKDSGTIQILFGDGNGAFPNSVLLDAKTPINSLITADFNGDGKADIAAATIDGIVILLNAGGGQFSETIYHAGEFPGAVAAGDFNGDGKLDLVAVNTASADATVLLGNGDGSFHAMQQTYKMEARPLSVVVADFNRDGKLDFAVAKAGSASISVFLGNGDGTFTPAPVASGHFQPEWIDSADFNGDGKPDLIVSYANTALAAIFFGNGDGTFSSANDIPGGGALFVTVADVNRDGVPDLLMPIFTGQDVQLLLGKGDGTFSAPISLAAPLQPSAVAVGDFNGDGQMDLAITNQGSNSLAVFLGDCPAITRKHAVRR